LSETDARGLRAALREAATVLGVSLTETQLEKLACYAGLVVRWNKFANLTGARDELAFAHKFIADALAVARFVRGPMVADLGSGSGLPGIVLAILEPAWQLVLVEARSRRARFLSQVRINWRSTTCRWPPRGSSTGSRRNCRTPSSVRQWGRCR